MMNFKDVNNITIFVCVLICPFLSLCEVLTLDVRNFDVLLKSHHLVLVNFQTPWCRFSRQLEPIFEEAYNNIHKKYINTEDKSVVFGSVNCDGQSILCSKYRVKKYPTLKLFRDGRLLKREYRGQRSVQSLVNYIDDEFSSCVKEFKSLNELKSIRHDRRTVIGYFEKRESAEYENFKKAAQALRDECLFYAGFGAASVAERTTGDNVVFHYHVEYNPELVYLGSLKNSNLFHKWMEEQCLPLVREITFHNAEELTEEGLPFLLLFHNREDTESLDIFEREVSKLAYLRSNFTFLFADCHAFSHPLFHLGKSEKDCPIVIIDSFRHMYMFPKFSKITEPETLKLFMFDFESGKLHREFHYGPDPIQPDSTKPEPEKPEAPQKETVEQPVAAKTNEKEKKGAKGNKQMYFITRESIFKKLKPSEHRYTFASKDEL